jgi:Zn finger protein HypA/HybF involved in hydrogenase expression
MKICPKCKEEVDDNFEICWNCQYDFKDGEVLKESNIGIICPSCHAEIDAHYRYCPYCKYDLKAVSEIDQHGVPGPVQQIDCLRCKTPMSFTGNMRFHEGTRIGALGNLFELFTNRESFDVYFCPKCGKVEFFLPEVPG